MNTMRHPLALTPSDIAKLMASKTILPRIESGPIPKRKHGTVTKKAAPIKEKLIAGMKKLVEFKFTELAKFTGCMLSTTQSEIQRQRQAKTIVELEGRTDRNIVTYRWVAK